MFIQYLAAVTFAALSVAMPVSNDERAQLLPREIKYSTFETPDNVPRPPAGQCALVVVSGSDIPFGSAPSSAKGQGIAPAYVGSAQAGVINHQGEVVARYRALNTESPGFSAEIQLDDDKINDAAAIKMTADWIDPSSPHWGIKWTYKDQHQDCRGICVHTDIGGVVTAKTAVTANFVC